jgi:hypothetical protein
MAAAARRISADGQRMNPLRIPQPVRYLVAVGLLGSCVQVAAQEISACGPLANHYGPFDYRTQRGRLKVVEDYHFTPEVESLVRGKSGTSAAADLSYLMRTSPNHHRGLMAILRLSERTKSPQPPNLQYSVECYFDRAIRFKPDDTVVRVLYAQHLGRDKRTPQALAQLKVASEFARDNALSHFNIGLAYLELGDDAHALEQAHKARALGLDRPELEDRLKAKGAWKAPAS